MPIARPHTFIIYSHSKKHEEKCPKDLPIQIKSVPLHRFRKARRCNTPKKAEMVTIVQLVRASDCGSECRGFESH